MMANRSVSRLARRFRRVERRLEVPCRVSAPLLALWSGGTATCTHSSTCVVRARQARHVVWIRASSALARRKHTPCTWLASISGPPKMPFNTTTQAYPPFAEGAAATGPRATTPSAYHSLARRRSSIPSDQRALELLKGFKTLDATIMAASLNDILRGLSVFSLSSDDKKARIS